MKKDSLEKSYELEWPKEWSLENNKFGTLFDGEARIRMIETGRKLIPYLLKYADLSSKKYLEIGPFFVPAFFYDELIDAMPKDKEVTFLENDKTANNWLSQKFNCNILDIDINAATFPNDLKEKMSSKFKTQQNYYDVTIVGQLMNYVDYKLLLKNIYPYVKPGGQVFINNVVGYGLPVLFSKKRPKSNQEIINTVISLGYKIILQKELPKMFKQETNTRLILVMTK